MRVIFVSFFPSTRVDVTCKNVTTFCCAVLHVIYISIEKKSRPKAQQHKLVNVLNFFFFLSFGAQNGGDIFLRCVLYFFFFEYFGFFNIFKFFFF
jgi:hypothetical protein